MSTSEGTNDETLSEVLEAIVDQGAAEGEATGLIDYDEGRPEQAEAGAKPFIGDQVGSAVRSILSEIEGITANSLNPVALKRHLNEAAELAADMTYAVMNQDIRAQESIKRRYDIVQGATGLGLNQAQHRASSAVFRMIPKLIAAAVGVGV